MKSIKSAKSTKIRTSRHSKVVSQVFLKAKELKQSATFLKNIINISETISRS